VVGNRLPDGLGIRDRRHDRAYPQVAGRVAREDYRCRLFFYYVFFLGFRFNPGVGWDGCGCGEVGDIFRWKVAVLAVEFVVFVCAVVLFCAHCPAEIGLIVDSTAWRPAGEWTYCEMEILVVHRDISRLSVKRDVAPKWSSIVSRASGCHMWTRPPTSAGENFWTKLADCQSYNWEFAVWARHSQDAVFCPNVNELNDMVLLAAGEASIGRQPLTLSLSVCKTSLYVDESGITSISSSWGPSWPGVGMGVVGSGVVTKVPE